jgi:hypothetical protein
MRLALLALVIAAPAFAAPAKGTTSVCPKAKAVTMCSSAGRGHVTAELKACGGFDIVEIYTPGPTDQSVLAISEKLQPEPKVVGKPKMGAPKHYQSKSVSLSVNWTTSPDKSGGHHGTLSYGSTKNLDVSCKMVK